MSGSRVLLSLFLFGWGLASVGQGQEKPAAQSPANEEAANIEKILSVQTDAWNAGDLEKFMSTYWKSPKLSFSSGGETTYGWQETLERYRRGYAPPNEMGKLNFDGLKVSKLGKNAALVLGNWHLKMADQSTKDGNFSLVLRKIKGS